VVLFVGCGALEKTYDEANYESLTNERGDVYVLSGGQVVFTYENAEILYSSSDTQAMWIVCDGTKYYLQGDCVVKLRSGRE
jgi:hypothetical protein